MTPAGNRDRLQKHLGRLQLRDVRAARNDSRRACGKPAASSCDIGGGSPRHVRRPRTRTGTSTAELGPQVKPGQRIAGSTEHFGSVLRECFATIAHQLGMISLKFRREQPAHRDVGDRCQPLALDAAAMLRNASRPFAENGAPQSARMSLVAMLG